MRPGPHHIGTTGASDGDFLGYDPDTDEYGPMAPPSGSGITGLTSADASVTITDNGDGTLDLAAAGGGGGGGLASWAHAERTAGDVTVNSASYINIDTALDLTLAAVVGDLVGLSILATVATGTTFLVLDFVTMVSGTVTNSVTTNGAPSTTASLGSWGISSANGSISSGEKLYVIQAGDVVSGQVTFRLRGRGNGRVLRANTDPRLYVSAKNYG